MFKMFGTNFEWTCFVIPPQLSPSALPITTSISFLFHSLSSHLIIRYPFFISFFALMFLALHLFFYATYLSFLLFFPSCFACVSSVGGGCSRFEVDHNTLREQAQEFFIKALEFLGHLVSQMGNERGTMGYKGSSPARARAPRRTVATSYWS